jgi:hypothetical protein
MPPRDVPGGGEAPPPPRDDDDDRPPAAGRRGSFLAALARRASASWNSPYIVDATLVVDDDDRVVVGGEGEVIEATTMAFCQRRWKVHLALTVCVLLPLTIGLVFVPSALDMLPTGMPTAEPSPSPSTTPTFDRRPTLEIVQERGHLLCGVGHHGSGLDASVANFTDLVSFIFHLRDANSPPQNSS